MHNAHKVEEQSRELNEKIVEKAAAIMQLRTQLNSIGEENHQIQSECRQLKEEILRHRSNEEELSNRNTAVREKFSNVDINLKKEADKINDEMKAFFKKLGLKVKLCPTPADRFVELKIHFIEKRDCHVLFTYDPLTEDYDCKLNVSINLFSLIMCNFSSRNSSGTSTLPAAPKIPGRNERHPRLLDKLSQLDPQKLTRQ